MMIKYFFLLFIHVIDYSPIKTIELPSPKFTDDRYQNPWPSDAKGFTDFFKWTFSREKNTSLPEDTRVLDVTLPVHKLSTQQIKDFCSQDTTNKILVIWIGHSSILLNFKNKIILLDPVFSERASPFQFVGPKRYRPIPFGVEEIPRLDAIAISHDHYDHLDYSTIEILNRKFGCKLNWFVGRGLKKWLRSNDITCNVNEFSWWEFTIFKDIQFTFVPAQHWSGRGLFDRNKVLWGGWVMESNNTKIYFAGDTGYCEVFKNIGEKFGSFDLSFIPIGAYQPRWFMKNYHIDPEEAVKIHKEVKSKKSIGIHWGTFAMTDEHYLEPKEKLRELGHQYGLGINEFQVLQHGQIFSV